MFGLTSWKTTAGGIAGILGGIGTIATMYKNGNWDMGQMTTAFSAITVGLGLLAAKDYNVSNSPRPVQATAVPTVLPPKGP